MIRAELETRLYDLRYDMDCIGHGDELKEAIHGLSDEDLVAEIEEQEDELAWFEAMA